jgi:hypothetical protein
MFLGPLTGGGNGVGVGVGVVLGLLETGVVMIRLEVGDGTVEVMNPDLTPLGA